MFSLLRLGGLPAHPLVVHLPIVLLPLAAIGTTAMAVSARMRRTLGWAVLSVLVVAVIGVRLASWTGGQLEEATRESSLVEAHAEDADRLLPVSGLFLLAAGALVVVDDRRRRGGLGSLSALAATRLVTGLAVLAVGVGAMTTLVVIDVGHSGATAVWHDRQLVGGR